MVVYFKVILTRVSLTMKSKSFYSSSKPFGKNVTTFKKKHTYTRKLLFRNYFSKLKQRTV